MHPSSRAWYRRAENNRPDLMLLLLMALLLGLGAALPVTAQEIPEHLLRRISPGPQIQPENQLTIDQLLEGPVDPALYILGPGDAFRIQVRGRTAFELTPRIDPEGWILLGEFGSISVGGLTLQEGRGRIRSHLASHLRDGQVDVLLRDVRQFKVFVVGLVANPGAYSATAATRASEAIALAGGLLGNASGRTIRILRKATSQSLEVDLTAFQLAGELDRNPFLADGDRIIVPVRAATFSIEGAVGHSGMWDLRTGDTLEGVLGWIGILPGADSHATLARFRNTGNSGAADQFDTLTVDLDEVLGGVSSLPLQNGDRVYIRRPSRYLEGSAVGVQGHVRYPGLYPITVGETRLHQAITAAGGPLPGALTSRVTLVRRSMADSLLVPPAPRPMQSLLPDSKEAVRQYLKTSPDAYRMTIDLERGEDPLLLDGDWIRVPLSSGFVRVTGEVVRPGLYALVEDWKTGNYLNAAGGTTGEADTDRTRLIRGPEGTMTVASAGTPVSSDDIIFVPEKIRRPPRTTWETVRDIFSIVGILATVVLVVDQVQQ